LLFVFKVKEVVTFFEAASRRHLPFTENVITFFLSAEQVQLLTGECRDTCICFDLIIDEFMFGPFGFARAVQEVNFIPTIFAEKGFDCKG